MQNRVAGSIVTRVFHDLGAGGREFESRHSDHKKSHDIMLEVAFISWLYLLYKYPEWAGRCCKNATNSGSVLQQSAYFFTQKLSNIVPLWRSYAPR